MQEFKLPNNRILKMEQDDCPLNPREDWDNLGNMICFHNNYSLGDYELSKETIQSLDLGIDTEDFQEIWKKYLNPNNRLRRENGASNFDLHYSYLKDGNPPPKNRLI